MGLLSSLLTAHQSAPVLAQLSEPVADPGTLPPLSSLIPAASARHLIKSIPSVRKAESVIKGTISTFGWRAWTDDGNPVKLTDRRLAWLTNHHRARLLPWLLRKTLDDTIWFDRSIWKASRYVDGVIARVERVHPSRITTESAALDPDTVAAWYIDGRRAVEDDLIIIDAADLGGLNRRSQLLELYLDLQDAAHRYANAPHPHAILRNSGADLTDDEVDKLLDTWEAARTTRAVGYLNSVVEYQTVGWNAQELQLTEAREHAALEVARLFGLSARDLDAKSGASMTYSNAVEARRDRLEALRQWMVPITAAVSHDTRPINVDLAVDAYTRDDPAARMSTWVTALDAGILTLDQVQRLEPLAQEY